MAPGTESDIAAVWNKQLRFFLAEIRLVPIGPRPPSEEDNAVQVFVFDERISAGGRSRCDRPHFLDAMSQNTKQAKYPMNLSNNKVQTPISNSFEYVLIRTALGAPP